MPRVQLSEIVDYPLALPNQGTSDNGANIILAEDAVHRHDSGHSL